MTADTIQRAIGARIREARIKATLAQQELADLVGVERGSISRWENGTRAVPVALIPRIAAALQTTVAHLTGEQMSHATSSPPTAPVLGAPWLSVDQSHLHSLERDTITQIVAALAEQPGLLPAVLDTITFARDPAYAKSQGDAVTAALAQLRGVNVDELTPVEALRLLAELRQMVIHSG